MSKVCGRARELDSVRRFLLAADSGAGGVFVIDGPPVTGKTALLHEAVRLAREQGIPVVMVSAAFGDLVGGSSDVDVALAAERAALVVIDHAHLHPAGVLALLPRLRDRPLSLLMAMNGATAGPEVQRAVAARAEVVVVGPVDDAVVDEMARELLGAVPHADLSALLAGAGGNPRLVAELVEGLREEGQLELRGGVAHVRGGWLPQRVATLIRDRVEVLSAKATQLLRVAAVVGRSFLLHDVATMMSETTASLLLAVDEVLDSGLLVPVHERLEFPGDLVRRAVVESIPRSILHALRHDVAVLRPPFSVEPTARPLLPRDVGGDIGADVVQGVRTLAASGRLGSAIALARDTLAQRVSPTVAAELHCVLAGILLADGRPGDAVVETDHALTIPSLTGPLRGLAAAGRLLGLYFANGSRVREHALSLLTVRDRDPSDADAVMAATVHSCLEWNAGNLAEGVYWGRESTKWPPTGPSAWWFAHTPVAYASKLAALGEFAEAEQLLLGDGPDTDEAVTSGAPAARLIGRSRVFLQAGRLVEAQAAAQAGLAMAHDRGLRLLVPLVSTVLGTIAIHRGEYDLAAEHVRRYRGDLAGGEAVLHSGQYDWVELLLAHAQGGPARAAELARLRVSEEGSLRRMLIDEPTAAPWLVRLALTVGDSRLAAIVLASAEDLAANNPGYSAVSVSAAHAHGLVDRDIDAVLNCAGRHRHPWAKACANADLMILFTDRGEPREAELHLAVARRILERMGADGDIARLRTQPDEPNHPQNNSTQEWHRLSEPERDIARLVGAGLTNRQVAKQLFLSPHTVNYHLRGIFRKLGINSRVELARLAHQQTSTRS
ncbi:LuxR C-terminal-related transcriptional regulator [Umezawaea sp. Da 62-37]|uniref:helix-turn-helix transcriptional regulator n=1 Tax=Umezawaea sp. Da 62-37 TaxID=3075927 RepID=UPI0028F706D9|nr:LuxR C-terminal-related transcriptional regulator [Umezawaea sp. Da 62-37]WNV84216.1 LuxR C-terminal-related transcriptional regulator [Umezawaea sp. Da 62-37]